MLRDLVYVITTAAVVCQAKRTVSSVIILVWFFFSDKYLVSLNKVVVNSLMKLQNA